MAHNCQNRGIWPRTFKYILFQEEVLGGGCLLHYSISGKCIDELKSRNFPIYEYFSREQYRTEDALLHLRFALCLKDLLVFFLISVFTLMESGNGCKVVWESESEIRNVKNVKSNVGKLMSGDGLGSIKYIQVKLRVGKWQIRVLFICYRY